MGRTTQVAQDACASGGDAYHADTLQLEFETITYGSDLSTPHLKRRLHRPADSLLRPSAMELAAPNGSGGWLAAEHFIGYEYDTVGRLYRFKDHDDRYYTYDCEPESARLVKTVTRAHLLGGSPVARVTTNYNYHADRDILDTVSHRNVTTNTVMSSYDYAINALGQRTGVVTGGSGYGTNFNWTWGYNAAGELTSGNRSVGTAHDRFYSYDGIGNRTEHRDGTSVSTGGTATTYSPNALNQYTALSGGITASPVHDDDGNLTSGVLPANLSVTGNYVWNGENRLVEAKSGTTTVGTYRYDHIGRRISKTAGGATTWFLYDGWNLVAEYSSTPALLCAYTWGLDLSVSTQGAGGVGGLLRIKETGGTHVGVHYPLYDGNGNITQTVKETNNNSTRISSRQEIDYDPFGREIRVTGGYAAAIPFRFSTKYFDAETGFLYYGYRYYDPVTGRWPSRDPIGERGGVNLYGFVGNNGISRWDFLGREMQPIDESTNLLEWAKELEKRAKEGKMTEEAFEVDLVLTGCVGICKAYQGGWGKSNNPSVGRPEQRPNTTCYETETQANAAAKNCPEGTHPFVFAKQGVWAGGKKPSPSEGGVMPNDSITGKGDNQNDYNYVSSVNGKYIYMNCAVSEKNLNDDPEKEMADVKIFVDDEAPKADAEIWCVTCCPQAHGWKKK